MSGARDLLRWAAEVGIEGLGPEQYPRGDHRASYTTDYGNIVEKTPDLVLRPRSVDELATAVRRLSSEQVPFTVRGSGHSSGGQALTDGGCVLDLGALAGIVADDAAREETTVLGGTFWLSVCDALHAQRRRPMVLTDNLRTSVGGTLAVGGFGDSSHLHGLQIDQVRRLGLVTPDGSYHRVAAGEPLFDHVLGGRGQLGIIADATIATMSRTHLLIGHLLNWTTIESAFEGALANRAERHYELFRMRLCFDEGAPMNAMAARYVEQLPRFDPGPGVVGASKARPFKLEDPHAFFASLEHGEWKRTCPAIEIVLPMPEAVGHLSRLREEIRRSGLARWLPQGSSVMVVPSQARLPLAPLCDSELSVILALRPRMPASELPNHLPQLRRIGQEALELGGRIYLMSIDVALDPERFLALQWGEAGTRLRRMKAELDPMHLLNRGLLPRAPSS